MEEKKNMTSVPYVVYESAMARNERTFKKMWSALILMVLLLIGSNVGWLIHESQFEMVEVYQEASEEEHSDTENLSDL